MSMTIKTTLSYVNLDEKRVDSMRNSGCSVQRRRHRDGRAPAFAGIFPDQRLPIRTQELASPDSSAWSVMPAAPSGTRTICTTPPSTWTISSSLEGLNLRGMEMQLGEERHPWKGV